MKKRPGLAARRKAVGLSQEGLAEALDTARSTVARWERGEVAPQPAIRARLAEILQISLDDLDHLLRGGELKKARDHVSVGQTEPVGLVHIERARDWAKQLLVMDRTFGGTRIADLAADSARAFERRMVDAGIRPGYHSEAHAVAAESPYWSWWLNDEQMELQHALLLKDLGEHELAIERFREYPETWPESLYFALSLPNLALSEVRAGAWRDAEGAVETLSTRRTTAARGV
jgi:transcriptional regulator with XRE-family HTH domain